MIRVAVLGAGIGREHLAAYRKLPDLFSVVMVVDKDRARAEEIRGDGRFTTATDVDDALSDGSIDLIDICLPPHLHAQVTVKALEAGKNVICEKPLATSVSDIDRIRAAANTHGRTVFPVFQYRWGPALAQLRTLISKGLAGRPQAASIETHWSRDADYYAVPWRGTWAGEQGGAVLGHAIHNHDLLTHFMGPVARLSAMTATRVNDIETEDCASISFEMENGALATSSITLGAAFNESRIRLVFENLTATSGTAPYAPGSVPWSFVARSPENQNAINSALAGTPGEPVGFEGFLTEVANFCTGKENRAVTLEEGASSIALVTAIYQAHRTQSNVSATIAQTHPLYKGWLP